MDIKRRTKTDIWLETAEGQFVKPLSEFFLEVKEGRPYLGVAKALESKTKNAAELMMKQYYDARFDIQESNDSINKQIENVDAKIGGIGIRQSEIRKEMEKKDISFEDRKLLFQEQQANEGELKDWSNKKEELLLKKLAVYDSMGKLNKVAEEEIAPKASVLPVQDANAFGAEVEKSKSYLILDKDKMDVDNRLKLNELNEKRKNQTEPEKIPENPPSPDSKKQSSILDGVPQVQNQEDNALRQKVEKSARIADTLAAEAVPDRGGQHDAQTRGAMGQVMRRAVMELSLGNEEAQKASGLYNEFVTDNLVRPRGHAQNDAVFENMISQVRKRLESKSANQSDEDLGDILKQEVGNFFSKFRFGG